MICGPGSATRTRERHDRGFDAELLEALFDLMFQEVAQIDLRETQIAMLIPFHIRQSLEILRVQALHQALRQDGDSIGPAHFEPLQHGSTERVDQRRERYGAL